MNTTLAAPKQNQTLECIRMLACVLVVFAHVPFPGRVGELISCLFRFAVPFFFALSGFFSYGKSVSRLTGRLKHILLLNGAAILICLASDCLVALSWGGSVREELLCSVPDLSKLARWVFLHINPFGGHLWYLTAIAFCYGVAILYTGFFPEGSADYRALYLTGFFLFLLRFAGADILAFGDVRVDYYLFRDGVFIGLPMFAMGMFLGQYWQRILENYRLIPGKLIALLVLGIGLSLLQWKGLSIQELPLGAVIQVMALLLLCAARPNIPGCGRVGQKVLSQFRFLSTWVYIIHLPVKDLYEAFLLPLTEARFGSREMWLRPIAVLTLSIALCLLGKLPAALWGRKSAKEGKAL